MKPIRTIPENRRTHLRPILAGASRDGFPPSPSISAGLLILLLVCLLDIGNGHAQPTFTKVTNAITATLRKAFDAAWADYDNDGRVDLFLANAENQHNELFRNLGNGEFLAITNAQSGTITRDAGNSWSAAWGDYDRDGF